MDAEHQHSSIGRSVEISDTASPGAQERLSAVLDHRIAPWRTDELMPLGHWLHFLPTSPQCDLGSDGHPQRGGFLPLIKHLPRRMWAGSRLTFKAAVLLGSAIRRRSTIKSMASKTGATGEMVFVTVSHEIFAGDALAICEEQDIVYRGISPWPVTGSKIEKLPTPHSVRRVLPDAVMLFRYSALTFNAHRIHYDRGYACGSEHYPGLVVQGPLIATLLVDHFLRRFPAAHVRRFEFRARHPMFDGEGFDLCLRGGPNMADLWTQTEDGNVTMRARIEAE